MGRLAVAVMLLGSMSVFGQLSHIDGFKKNKVGLYEMSFRDISDAIRKYNYVSDMNGADTSAVVYNVMNNPIDFSFFGDDPDRMIVSILMRDDNKYRVMFGEFDSSTDKFFFDIVDETGEPVRLVYRVR